jgi:hypothetical protein
VSNEVAPAEHALRVERSAVRRVLVAVTVLIVLLGTASALLLRGDVPFAVDSLGRMLLLDEEANVASWWGATLLLLAAIGLAVASAAVPERRGRLRILALLLVLLSLDETAILHERATGALLLLATGSPEGDLPVWVIAALPIVAVVAVVLVLPVLRSLPADVRRLWWLAAGLYLGGAIGVEVLTNLLTDRSTVVYQFGVALEEGMEYAGPIVLLDSLLLLASGGRDLRLRWSSAVG